MSQGTLRRGSYAARRLSSLVLSQWRPLRNAGRSALCRADSRRCKRPHTPDTSGSRSTTAPFPKLSIRALDSTQTPAPVEGKQAAAAPISKTLDVVRELADGASLHVDLKHEIIITTEAKLRIALTDYKNALVHRRAWGTPLSILATLILGMLTADFRDFLGWPASFWERQLLLIMVAVAVWTLVAAIRSAKAGRGSDVGSVVHSLKTAGDGDGPEAPGVRSSPRSTA